MGPESLPEHILRPHLRPVQPRPVFKAGKPFIVLRDPAMLVSQTLVIPAQALAVLQHFQGNLTVGDIAEQLKGDAEQFTQLARRLDEMGLLWGPTFEQLESDLRESLDKRGSFPMTSSRTMGEDAEACRSTICEYLEKSESPDLEAPPRGIVAPHLDYPRGWPNYAAAYYACQEMEPPDRVVILGTNHMGMGDGVILSEYGFESPMGTCPADAEVVARLKDKLGRPLLVDQLDHLPEHSIQLHLPWLQYFFGDLPLVAALIPDPIVGMISDDGERVAGEQFIDSLSEVLEDLGGETFFVASSDLSHVGLQFGEPRPVDEQRRMDVERHDRDMLANFLLGDPGHFLSGFQWNKNPTRWCSIGNMYALLKLTTPATVELIDYRQAYDERGFAMVSSAAMAVLG